MLQQHGSFGRAGAGNAPGAASKPGPSIGAAVATRVVSFSLAWACPDVKFAAGTTYHR